MEQEREHLRRQQALVEMSALLAHEIRNPLGSLELFAGLLAESGLEGESRRWVEHMQAGLRSLSSTVNNVLDLHNEPPVERASMDAGELLCWAYDFLLPLAHQARVELQIVNGLCGVPVAADRHLLEQVLLNLALNAFRFMPGGGWLTIRGKGGARKALKSRCGIRARAFRRKTCRVSSRRDSHSAGIVRAWAGSVPADAGSAWRVDPVESQIGHGAAFRLRLPAASAPVAVPCVSALAQNKKRVAPIRRRLRCSHETSSYRGRRCRDARRARS